MPKKIKPKYHYLPGDKQNKNDINNLLRVNHAGEYGAVRIYTGQIAATKNTETKAILQHMLEQEIQHEQKFHKLINQNNARPSLLSPVWHIGGYMLGYATAKLGNSAAMACTEAVENVIDKHYEQQYQNLNKQKHPELAETLNQFRLEEIEHRDTAIQHGAHNAIAYPLLSAAIQKISHLSIWLAQRL